MFSQFPLAATEVIFYLPIVLPILMLAKRPWHTTLWAYLFTLMFMVERGKIDLPLLPPIGKQEYACIAAFITIQIRMRDRARTSKPLRGVEAIMFVMWAGAAGTWWTNREQLSYGIREPTVLPPLTFYEVLSMSFRDVFVTMFPFYVGRVMVRSEEDMRNMLTTVLKATLIYSGFTTFESIFSPQLHRTFYGFHQHIFDQCRRMGGWRPMVFMEHGLAVANFMLAGAVAAYTLARARVSVWGLQPRAVQIWSTLSLINMKSTGALMFALMVLPMVLLRPAKTQLKVAAVLFTIATAYPLLKVTDLFPDKQIVEVTKLMSKERAQSVEFRFMNDVMLLQKTAEKRWFGWGGFGRNMLYDMYGRDITTIDGYWVGQYSTRGIVGLFGSLFFLLAPLFLAVRRTKNIQNPQLQLYVASLALMSGCFTLDLMPNGLFNLLPFFFAGALYGSVTFMSDPKNLAATAPQPGAAWPPPGAWPQQPGVWPPGAWPQPPGAWPQPPGAWPPPGSGWPPSGGGGAPGAGGGGPR
jgi:hypothetical protein